MSEYKTDAGGQGQGDEVKPAEEPPFKITPETHGIGMLLLSPSSLGRAFTGNQLKPECDLQCEVDRLNLTENGLKAVTELRRILGEHVNEVRFVATLLQDSYAGSQPHPDDLVASAMIAQLQKLG